MKDEKFYNDLREKLADFEMPVSDDMWSSVEDRLKASSSPDIHNAKTVSPRKTKTVFLWGALAAACVAGAVFFIRPNVMGEDTVAIVDDADNNRTETVSGKTLQGDMSEDGNQSGESSVTTDDMTLDNGVFAERVNSSHANGNSLAIVSKDGAVQEDFRDKSKGREDASKYSDYSESNTSNNIASSSENHNDIIVGSSETASEKLYAKTDAPTENKEEAIGVVQSHETSVVQQEKLHSVVVHENEKQQRSVVVRDREPQWYAYEKMMNKRHASHSEHKGMLASVETGVHVGGASGRMVGMDVPNVKDKWTPSTGMVGWGDPISGFGIAGMDNGKVPQGWGSYSSGVIYDSSWGDPGVFGMTNANSSQSSNSPMRKITKVGVQSGIQSDNAEGNPYSQVPGVEVLGMQKSPMLALPQKQEKSVDEISDEEHDFPIRLGWSLRYYLTDRLSLESGVNYTFLKSTLMNGNGKSSKQMLHYFGVPLSIGYSFLKYNNLSVYASLGAEVDYMAFGKIGNDKVTTHPFQLSASARLGAQYSITETLGMFLEPGVIYYFDDRSSLHTIFKKQPWEFGISAGLRINIR